MQNRFDRHRQRDRCPWFDIRFGRLEFAPKDLESERIDRLHSHHIPDRERVVLGANDPVDLLACPWHIGYDGRMHIEFTIASTFSRLGEGLQTGSS